MEEHETNHTRHLSTSVTQHLPPSDSVTPCMAPSFPLPPAVSCLHARELYELDCQPQRVRVAYWDEFGFGS